MSFGVPSRFGLVLVALLGAAPGTASAEQSSPEQSSAQGSSGTATASTTVLGNPGRVRVVLEGATNPLLIEALIRIEAELHAARFVVSTSDSLGDDGSELRLSVDGSSVRIEARAASGGGEIVQRVRQSGSAGSAEIIAVRAVESLRAALLLAMRDGTLDERTVSADVRHFVGLDEPSTEPEVEQPPPPAPAPRLRPERVPRAEPPPWVATLGPLAASWGRGTPLDAGAEATLRYRARWWSIGVLVDGTFAGGQLETTVGNARLQSLSVLARPALELPLGKSSGASLGADMGLHQLWLFPSLPSGGSLATVSHSTLSAQFDAELHAFFGQFGLYGRGRVGALADAPTIVEGNVALGRPVWSIGVGLAARFGAGSTER